MTSLKSMICITNSRKHGQHCIAGKELLETDIGKWIRPVSNLPTGELTPRHFQLSDGRPLNILDIVKIPLLKKDLRPTMPYQTENYIIDEKKPWERIGCFPKANLLNLVDDITSLWYNGDRPGMNDRIALGIAKKMINTSLALIKPDNLELRVSDEYGRRRVSANFSYKDTIYKLRVTDYRVLNEFSSRPIDTYKIQPESLICISLGEPYQDYCYKLVASILYI